MCDWQLTVAGLSVHVRVRDDHGYGDGGWKFDMEVFHGSTICEVKLKAKGIAGIVCEKYHAFRAELPGLLEDDKTLASYGIEENSILDLYPNK